MIVRMAVVEHLIYGLHYLLPWLWKLAILEANVYMYFR